MTKQSLAIISHTLERAAEPLGASALMIGAFQHETYFAPQAQSFRRLHEHGVATIATYAGPDPSPAADRVVLRPSDPLTRIWAAVLVSDTLCGFVHAVDLEEFGDTTDGLEPARLFDAEVGFTTERSRAVAEELIERLVDAGLDPSTVRLPPEPDPAAADHPATRAWAAGMDVLARRLAAVSDTWRQEHAHAVRDPLTGLTNREGLLRWSGTTASTVPNGPIGLVMFDLNGFKLVNDHLGHEAGDAMLARVAQVIAAHTRRGDLAVRWGGDEFLLVCPGVADHEVLAAIGKRVSDEVGTIEVGGMRASVAFGCDVRTARPVVVADADAAMYRAKRARSN